MQFFATLLLMVVPCVLAAPGDTLGIRHPDFGCSVASDLALIEGACTAATGSRSINFAANTNCNLHRTVDCSDSPDYRLLPQGCQTFMPGDEVYMAIKCSV